jgi:hypothetical protein
MTITHLLSHRSSITSIHPDPIRKDGIQKNLIRKAPIGMGRKEDIRTCQTLTLTPLDHVIDINSVPSRMSGPRFSIVFPPRFAIAVMTWSSLPVSSELDTSLMNMGRTFEPASRTRGIQREGYTLNHGLAAPGFCVRAKGYTTKHTRYSSVGSSFPLRMPGRRKNSLGR